MQQITEQQILALAPNPAAAANGRKISQKGGFVRLECSADDTFYMGECTGSGKSNYITSADFINQSAPVFRCTCPSRQFPCKHSLGLLYEMLAQKNFSTCEIPDDIQKKREKKQARDAKAADDSKEQEQLTPEEAAKKKAAKDRSSKSAKTKKLKTQLEGLELTSKLISDLMNAGLGTMGGTAINTYKQLSKQLGDYYLPGPQRLLNGLIIEITQFQKDGLEKHYDNAIDILEKFWGLVKKSTQYIKEKLENDSIEQDDNLLYEELGGIWKMSELDAIGKGKDNSHLTQLSFWVRFDEARQEFIDTSCYGDLDTGEIYMTYNYRPVKALKYVKQEDTIFGTIHVPHAVCYPGDGNVRIRWDGCDILPVSAEDLKKLKSHAVTSLSTEIKAIKNTLKNALAAPFYIKLLAFSEIGNTSLGLTLKNTDGSTILLGNSPLLEPTTDRLLMLPETGLFKNNVMLAAFFYDYNSRRIIAQPLSIIADDKIVRLLY